MTINKVGSKGIADGSVAAIDFAPNSVTSDKLADGTITNANLSNSSVTLAGTSIALGASGTLNNKFIDWQSIVVSNGSTVTTMVAGKGYFVNNTSAAGLVKLPISASIGDVVAIKDYAGNFGTNSLTIQRNGHNIQGVANDSLISTNRASLVLVYVDSTKGWIYWEEHNVADLQDKEFIAATGGTVATVGDFKIHAFTGDGNFVVSAVGNAAGSNTTDYLVVAGGGGGGADRAGGGGAGGFRMASGLPVGVQTYPITVGGGGAAGTYPGQTPGVAGSNSVFSTITSAGGGAGAMGGINGGNGGSGGGGGGQGGPGGCSVQAGGSGNTPPVSPPQGNNGGQGSAPNPGGTPTDTRGSGGGGGAGGVGGDGVTGGYPGSGSGGDGGAGASAAPIFGSNPQPFYGPTNGIYAGGGGGGTRVGTNTGGDGGPGGGGDGGDPNAPTAGTGVVNSGGGGGGAEGSPTYDGAAGGSGIVLIRYKFQ